MKLTQANVARARVPAGKSEQFFWDDEMPGFGLRLREGGGADVHCPIQDWGEAPAA